MEKFLKVLFSIIDFFESLPANIRFLVFCAWWFPTYPFRVARLKIHDYLLMRRIRRDLEKRRKRIQQEPIKSTECTVFYTSEERED